MLQYEYINNPNSIIRSRTGSINSNHNSKEKLNSNSQKWQRNFKGIKNNNNDRNDNEDSSSGKCNIF
jgi:hypothetical protein